MAIVHLSTWLNDPDSSYHDGVILYNEFGTSTFLKKLFAQGESTYTRERLRTELIVIDQERSKQVQPPVAPVQSVAAQTPPKPFNTSHYPEPLQKLVARKGELYKKCCYLHSQLEKMGTDKERLSAASIITNGFEEINQIWAQLDHFDEHKVMMSVNGYDHSRMSIYELHKRLGNLRTYISKQKNGKQDAVKLKKYEEEQAAILQILENRSIADD